MGAESHLFKERLEGSGYSQICECFFRQTGRKDLRTAVFKLKIGRIITAIMVGSKHGIF